MADISQINDNFVHSYLEHASQNSLMSLLAGDIKKIQFILKIAKDSFLTIDDESSRFEPNPLIYFNHIYPESTGDEIITKEDISSFFEIVSNIEEFFQLLRRGITTTSTDADLISYVCSVIPLGIKFIKLLYFFIFTNSIAFSSIIISGVSSRSFLFKISHSERKENEFYTIEGESKILFHGTSLVNLYSIMRNGIRTMSKSKYQTNGAAYGHGIYLTDVFSRALSYGSPGIRAINFQEQGIPICVLLFDCKKLNVKGGGFCFVQQEDEVILRCILLVEKANPVDIESSLISYAASQSSKYTPPQVYSLPKSLHSISSDFLTINDFGKEPSNGDRIIASVRFNKETEQLFQMIVAGDQTIIKANFLNPDDKHSPLLFLLMPDPDSDLGKDLKKYNIPGIKVALYFPTGSTKSFEYPNVPFKIRVVSPMFIDGTGRITKGGSLCADILYPEGWSPANRIEAILRNLIITISTEGSREGPGRIDPNRLGREYSYVNYLTSFGLTGGLHGYTAI